MKLAAGFLGAGIGFFLSGLLVGVFPGLLSSYQVVNILYSWGFFRPEDSFAGNFPDPLMSLACDVLLYLAALCLILAALFYFLARKKLRS